MNILDSGCPYEPVQSQDPLTASFPRLPYGRPLFLSAFPIFETNGVSKGCGKKEFWTRTDGWTAAVKSVMNSGLMRRIQECVLGLNKTGISSSTCDIWLPGICDKILQEDSSSDPSGSDGVAAFVEDEKEFFADLFLRLHHLVFGIRIQEA